jgi:hypothetical protein
MTDYFPYDGDLNELEPNDMGDLENNMIDYAMMNDALEEDKFDRSEIEVPWQMTVTETIVYAYSMVMTRFYREHHYMPKTPEMMIEINFDEHRTCWMELSVEAR